MSHNFDNFLNKFLTKRSKAAFSLIEISIVILIIGILIVGVYSGKDLYSDFKLKVAQNIAKNSIVNRIDDLIIWYDSTSESAFSTGTTTFSDKAIPSNQEAINRWRDINSKMIDPLKKHATQTTSGSQPLYVKNSLNGLPALRFDGVDDWLSYDGSFVINSEYSVFIVEQRNISDPIFIIGGSGMTADSFLSFGYCCSGGYGYPSAYGIRFSQGSDYFDFQVDTYKSMDPKIHSLIFSKTSGKKYYINSVNKASLASTVTIKTYPNPSIGNFRNANFYKGEIGEIIFFSRAVKDSERRKIEEYLAKKWTINLS